MAKIGVCSNWGLKFLPDILEYWKGQGHEVKYSLGYNPQTHSDSDFYFVDVCDRNAKLASEHAFQKPKLCLRAMDIEAWVRQPRAIKWENVHAVAFSAPHIQRLVNSDCKIPETVKQAVVPFGLDVRKWTFSNRDYGAKRIAMVCHRWAAKGIPLALQIMKELGEGYSIHFLGTPSKERWLHAYIEDKIERWGIDATFTESVKSVNTWLDNGFSHHLLTSYKETFSYATAEAMAKGIRPVMHSFYGADEIWPHWVLFDAIDDAAAMIESPLVESRFYREYIEENHSMQRMMQGLNGLFGIGGGSA